MAFIHLAWRNIWRNPVRSLIVMGAVVTGIWAAIALSGFITGLMQNYISHAIENVVSHLQIHHAGFLAYQENQYTLEDPAQYLNQIDQIEAVRSVSARTVSQAMVSTASGVRGLLIKGVDPESERRHTHLDEKIKAGQYFMEIGSKHILISRRTAGELNIKPRSKVIITLVNPEGEMIAEAFRVCGLFETGNNAFDERHAFVPRQMLQEMLGIPGDEMPVHEIAINLDHRLMTDPVKDLLKSRLPDLDIATYKERSPDLELYESMLGFTSILYITIIMLALVFGIINTMLMAVLERIREFGMLMAIGMNKIRVFLMIVAETLLLTIFAAPIGLLIAYGTIRILERTGIDLSAFTESLQEFGISTTIYPEVTARVYIQTAIALILTAVIASLYPALKAIRLRPVEAMRKL